MIRKVPKVRYGDGESFSILLLFPPGFRILSCSKQNFTGNKSPVLMPFFYQLCIIKMQIFMIIFFSDLMDIHDTKMHWKKIGYLDWFLVTPQRKEGIITLTVPFTWKWTLTTFILLPKDDLLKILTMLSNEFIK